MDSIRLLKPNVTFYQLYPKGPAPQRADPAPYGMLPLRGFYRCKPLKLASRFGWYLFPPFTFSLMSDGKRAFWKRGDSSQGDWFEFQGVALSEMTAHITQHAPEQLTRLSSMPFLSRGFEPDLVQIWSGVVIKTTPEWSVLLRPPANITRDPAFDLFDGIIETDQWLGPAITPLRVCRTDTPITFRRSVPFVQVQLVPKLAYAPETEKAMRVADDFPEDLVDSRI